MDINTTRMLENQINNGESIESFISGNEDNFFSGSLSEFLNDMLREKDLTKADVFKRADMVGDNYGYEMFNRDSKKKFSRDKVIKVCIGFPLTIDETQKALKLSGANPLYARNKRDSIIMIGIHNGLNADAIDEKLADNGEKILDDKVK